MENGIKHRRGTGRERVYNFIVEFIKNNGYAPSVREICTGTDLSSTSSVYTHLVEVTRTGYREVEAIDCDDAEQTASDLNACDGVQWSDFVNVVRVWEKDYEGMRWGDLSPENRKFLLSNHKLTDIDAWEKGEHKEFTGNGMCFVDLNAECCCINGIVHDGQLYINEDDVIVCV